ncbi:MAG: LuxR C-terminal-related transcriptional regulator [Burkholderiaceae bacterium]
MSTATDPHLSSMVQLCPLGLMLSGQRRVLACNQRFADLFGYGRDELVGQSLQILYPSEAEFERIGQRGIQVMAGQGDYQDERLMRRKNGLLQWFRVHGHAVDPADPFAQACWTFEPLSAGADTTRLTPREREVLAGLSRGLTAKEAAREMGLSPRTVEKFRTGLRTKFGAGNVTELMVRVAGLPS